MKVSYQVMREIFINRVSGRWFYLPFVLLLAFSMNAWAQWSNDPMQNLALSDIPGADQVQPKVLPLSDNGFFVSWFNDNPNDPPPQGYDVYLQRLNATGYEQLPHDGDQIANLTNTSTEDYGLGIDSQGNSSVGLSRYPRRRQSASNGYKGQPSRPTPLGT